MRQIFCRLGVLLSMALGAGGCVERKFVIEAYPVDRPNENIPVQVLRDGKPVGFTPADDAFVYYGKYEWTLIKDGYETLHLTERVRAPWYQYPVIDFFAENVWPFTIRDVRRFRVPMQPLRPVRPDEVLPRAQDLRTRGKQIGDPTPPQPVTPEGPVSGGVIGATRIE